jgi:multiple sugar transport system substrate-binding protein
MRFMLSTAAAALFAMSGAAQAQLSGDLKIFLDTSNPAPRATMEKMIADFQELHPELNIESTVIDREEYKTQIRNFLTANPPDVATWYAANRMRPYVEAGLFEDVSDLWAEPAIAENLASTKGAMTIDGKQWGVPYTYYQWGVYYRADIFAELGLEEPETFERSWPTARRSSIPAGPATPSAPSSCGPPAAGSTTSTCAPTASTSTWRWPPAR